MLLLSDDERLVENLANNKGITTVQSQMEKEDYIWR